MRNKNIVVGVLFISFPVLLCLLSFVWLPSPPNEMNLAQKLLPPGEAGYFLGTDQFGRDILSRVMIGSRSVLLVGLLSVSLGAVLGILAAAAAAFFKGFVDMIIMRGMDGLMAFPGILLSMLLITVVGKGRVGTIAAITLFMVTPFARLFYTFLLENEALLYSKAAVSQGNTKLRLLFYHYLPVFFPRLITQWSAGVGQAIMIEASLSFLGLGVQPPDASWGLMLKESRQFFMQYPYLPIAPGVMIFVTVLGFQLVGDGWNDMLLSRRGKW